MSARIHTAVLSVSPKTGTWRLFVALMGTTEMWPEHVFATAVVPTLSARAAALARLGYESMPDMAWEWTEDSTTPDQPVDLLASVKVREQTEGAA
ncbi:MULTISPECIES: DUF6303 family protein [unclassified Streptomyces]|uniref:DUF6303 family protein n=1 Tax=unclassified Streptomyces TaxID=2593676 RepID=UPI003326B5E7